MSWELTDVITIIEPCLSESRVNDCTKATRVLVASCGFIMAHGELRFSGSRVRNLYKMVGNVRQGNFTGGATNLGHQWLRVRYEKDGGLAEVDVDLSAKQFYTELAPRFMGNPTLPPMNVTTKQAENTFAVRGMEAWEKCGEHLEPVQDSANAALVLSVFQSAEGKCPGLENAMREVYLTLGVQI